MLSIYGWISNISDICRCLVLCPSINATQNVKNSGPNDKNAPPSNVKNGLLAGAVSVQWTQSYVNMKSLAVSYDIFYHLYWSNKTKDLILCIILCIRSLVKLVYSVLYYVWDHWWNSMYILMFQWNSISQWQEWEYNYLVRHMLLYISI